MSDDRSTLWKSLSLAWQLGYSIALPLVIFGLVGRFLDNTFGTSPWVMLGGIIIAAVTSTVWVVVRATKLMAEASRTVSSPAAKPKP